MGVDSRNHLFPLRLSPGWFGAKMHAVVLEHNRVQWMQAKYTCVQRTRREHSNNIMNMSSKLINATQSYAADVTGRDRT